MLFNPLVLVLAPEQADITSMRGVHASGFECRYFSSADVLYTEVQGLEDVQGSAVVLMGSSAENRAVVFYLRTIRAELGVIAQLQSGSEEEQMGLIQAGADWIFPVSASRDLIATMLLSLWDRRMQAPLEQPEAEPRRRGGWALTEYAWVLNEPSGVRISLTTSERALLVTLFDSPELTATYAALAAAVDFTQSLDARSSPRRRLGVLVSRLRSKCSRQGVDLPIRVLQNQGYMFVVSDEVLAPPTTLSLISVGSG